jgi:hypothetical protein
LEFEDRSFDELLNPLQFSSDDEAEQFVISTPRLEMAIVAEDKRAKLEMAKAAAAEAAHELEVYDEQQKDFFAKQAAGLLAQQQSDFLAKQAADALALETDDVEMAQRIAATQRGGSDDERDSDLDVEDPAVGSEQGSDAKPRKRRDMKERHEAWPLHPGVIQTTGPDETTMREDVPSAQGFNGYQIPPSEGHITSTVHNGVTAVGTAGAVTVDEGSLKQMASICKDMVSELLEFKLDKAMRPVHQALHLLDRMR